MAASEGPPEQTIRRWLARNGPVDVGIDAIEQTWELDTLTASDRRRIGRALEEAGVICEPPLRRAGRRDKLHLSLVPEAEAAEREKVAEPESEPVAEPEPIAEPEPEPRHGQAPAGDGTAALKLAPLAIALMVAGSLGPWAKSIFVVDYGLDRAGVLVIALAAVAGLLLLAHARSEGRTPLPLAAALVATVAVTVVVSEFRELLDDDLVGPAWGLYAAFAGSAAMVAIAMLQLARR
ncbi:MAG: hypothetical protein AABM31_08210 [Actinomycetota bacterium]